MRICEIAPGEKRNVQISKFDEVWNRLIVPNCSEILKIYSSSNKLLYRRTKKYTNKIFRGTSRNDRRPLDSYLFLSELFDIGLKYLGMTALKSNSIFASNDRSGTYQFGHNDYIIFPIDGFKYTYTKFADLTLNNEFEFIKHWANTEICSILNQTFLKDFNIDQINNDHNFWTSEFFNINDNLESIFLKINSLLIKHNIPPIKPIDLIDMDKFIDYIEPKNTGLLDILNSPRQFEVMINGSYYAFYTDIYSTTIKEKLYS